MMSLLPGSICSIKVVLRSFQVRSGVPSALSRSLRLVLSALYSRQDAHVECQQVDGGRTSPNIQRCRIGEGGHGVGLR